MKTLNSSLVVEAALAGLFAAAFVLPAAAQDAAPKGDAPADKPVKVKKSHKKMAAEKVHCMGVNACKGKGECAVEGGNSCAGQNSCKGKGWVSLTKKTCAKKNGTVVGAEKPAEKAPATPAATPAAK